MLEALCFGGGGGVGWWGDWCSSVVVVVDEEDMRFVRFFGGRDLLAAGVLLLLVIVTGGSGGGAGAGEDTGDKAGLGVEQLDVVEKRFVGVIVEEVVERLANEFRRLSRVASLPLPAELCDFEWRMSRFIRLEEKLHKWHLYNCCVGELASPTPPLTGFTARDRFVDELRMRTSCSLFGRTVNAAPLGDADTRVLLFGVVDTELRLAVATTTGDAFLPPVSLTISAHRFEEDVCLAGLSTAGSLMISGSPLVRRSAVATSAGNISMYL